MDVISAVLFGMVLDLFIYNAAASHHFVVRMGSTHNTYCGTLIVAVYVKLFLLL